MRFTFSKACRELSARKSLCSQSAHLNNSLGSNRAFALTSSFEHIPHVVFLGSVVQVVRSNTRRVVTAMQAAVSPWNGTVDILQRQAVSLLTGYKAIAITVERASPNPASPKFGPNNRPVLIDHLPKAYFNRAQPRVSFFISPRPALASAISGFRAGNYFVLQSLKRPSAFVANKRNDNGARVFCSKIGDSQGVNLHVQGLRFGQARSVVQPTVRAVCILTQKLLSEPRKASD